MEELTRPEVREYFRPNFWPNTPDILTEFLQTGGRPAFMLRLVLAATLTAQLRDLRARLRAHGAYAPGAGKRGVPELGEVPAPELGPGREDSLRPFIARVNRIRRENPALHRNDTLPVPRGGQRPDPGLQQADPGGRTGSSWS
jgi:starch synthase (maltosyl-transferring)